MRDKTFEINWRDDKLAKVFEISSNDAKIGMNIEANADGIKASAYSNNDRREFTLDVQTLDSIIMNLSSIKGEYYQLEEIKRNVFKELDNIYNLIKDKATLVFLIYYSDDESKFRLRVTDLDHDKKLFDRFINIDRNRFATTLKNSGKGIVKERFAQVILENLSDIDEPKKVRLELLSYLYSHIIISNPVYDILKNVDADTKATDTSNDDELKDNINNTDYMINEIANQINCAINQIKYKDYGKVPELLFVVYLGAFNIKHNCLVPCVKITSSIGNINYDEPMVNMEGNFLGYFDNNECMKRLYGYTLAFYIISKFNKLNPKNNICDGEDFFGYNETITDFAMYICNHMVINNINNSKEDK